MACFTSYKQKYSSMKTKLKAILYENELFQDELRQLQRELLDIYRDKETLLEKVIQYENIDSSSSESENQLSDNECNIESINDKVETTQIKPKSAPTSNKRRNTTAAKAVTKSESTTTPKPKAPSRNRSKATTTTNANTSTNTNKSRSKASQNNASKANQNNGSKASQNNGSKANQSNGSRANQNNGLKASQNNGSKQTPVKSQRQPVSNSQITHNGSQVLLANNPIGIVQQLTPIVTTMNNNLVPPIQTISVQPTCNFDSQFQQPQQHHQLMQHHQLHHQHHQQQTHHYSDPQTTLSLGIDGSQQHQQINTINQVPITSNQMTLVQHVAPIVTTISNNNIITTVPTLAGQQNHNICDQFRQQDSQQLMQHHQIHHQHQHHHHHHQQQQPQQQQQPPQQPPQPQQHHLQDSQSSIQMGIDGPQHHQQPLSQSSSNQLSEQNLQDLNHQQNTYSTQQLATEQLSAEELEQHLESRRMEQAALLLPDWESSVPSDIFNADSAIKFMAED